MLVKGAEMTFGIIHTELEVHSQYLSWFLAREGLDQSQNTETPNNCHFSISCNYWSFDRKTLLDGEAKAQKLISV